MPTPITHVVFAEEVRKREFPRVERRAYHVGTSFPDIRYLNVIKRDETHPTNIDFHDLKEAGPFEVGVKIHSLIDSAVAFFIEKNQGIFDEACPNTEHIVPALDIFMDQYFYGRVSDWNSYSEYLDQILPEEEDYGIDEDAIKTWHELLKMYFQNKPNDAIARSYANSLGFSPEKIEQIMENVASMRGSERIVEALENLYGEISDLIQVADLT